MEKGFEEYIKLLPNIPENIPENVKGYFLQLRIPDETGNLNSIINTTFEETEENEIKLLLDIHVFMEKSFSSKKEMWIFFNEVRDFKNRIFFSSITDKTLKMYEH